MKLMIGGACQNKRQAAQELFHLKKEDMIDGGICSFGEIFSCKAVFNFHEFIRRLLSAGEDTETLAREIIEKNPDIVILSDEIGYGIVPMDAQNRLWRERTGRICCELAAFSEMVVRVSAGLPQIIKEEQRI